MICVIILISALILNNSSFFGKGYFYLNIRLFIILCLLGFGSIFLYNLKSNMLTRIQPPKITWVDLAYLNFPLLIASFILFMFGKGLAFVETILLLPILIAASIMGKKTGLVMSTVCSLILIFYQISTGLDKSTIKTLESCLILISIMYVTGWFVGCLTDLETENRKYLVKLANTDMLTGLYNHRYFQEKLKRYFENAPEENTLSLIIIDIDYFKHYNDSFGHLEGDNVLKTIGEIIRESVLEPNYAARYGGEEFVVVLPGRDAREASRLAEIIRQKIENRHFPGGEHQPGGKVTVSCGIATYPDHASNARELVKHADLALYRAKSLNKNKVELYFSVFDDLELEEDEKELLNSIRTLVSVINAKDRYTYGHSERVTDFSIKLAQKLNLPEKDIRLLKYAAFLHDIGKIEIDRDILNKAGPPDKEQWFILRQHPQWGSDIVKSVAKLQPIAPAILHHHENFDGSGYPAGISGKDIPLPARIIRITDSYDAMTTDRPYKKSMSKDEAIREIKRCAGTMFDPDLVNLFISIIDDETKLADGPA